MVDVTTTDSPLDAASGAAGPHASEAFGLLGNETRLAILLALWEAYDPQADDNAVRFSRIFERVDYDDPGNLSYHLEKLVDQFVRQDAEREGYKLRNTGLRLIQAVIAGAGVQDETLEPTEIDQECPFCGAPTAVSYRDGLVLLACTTCEGPTPEASDIEGFLSAVPFEPAGLADRSAEEIRVASWIAARRQVQTFFDGLCPSCSGPVDAWLECCHDHEPAGICGGCGRRFAAWARFQCRICKNHSISSPKGLALFHPAVNSFYDDHGESTRVRADDFARARRVFGLMDDHEMEIVSSDPPRVAVMASLDGESIQLTFDETVRVVDVRR